MENTILFQRISWDDLQRYLHREACKINRDVDQDVRLLNYAMFSEQTVEGIYFDGTLVGFARWDRRNNHLSNLYVSPEYRGHGIAREFIQSRNVSSLYVMPHNHDAKRLYTKLGFMRCYCNAPNREFMIRPA